MADAEGEDYHYYGTPLEDENEGKSSAYRRPIKDPAQLRTLPVWKQEATDEQGRKRFHGAFTGGFSAGYFNTVGSAEGFQPGTFKSSRSARQALAAQSVDDFLDADEREERNRTVLTVKDDYDTFGTSAAEAARSAAQRETQQRPGLIPGPLIEEMVVPVANSIGMKLLQKLGWRPGRGIGTAAPSQQATGANSKWGSVAGVSLENTPLYVLEPKQDLHGLGFDPFAGAEEFRQAAKRRKLAERSGPGGPAGGGGDGRDGGAGAPTQQAGGGGGGGGGAAAGRRGIAFGTGALEETDTYGYLEDYVQDEDTGAGAGFGWGPSGRTGPAGRALGLRGSAVGALTVGGGEGRGKHVARNWEVLALSYEVVSEGEEDDDHRGRLGPGGRRAPLLLEPGGAPPPPLLQARGHGCAPDSLIPGFRPSRSSAASGVVLTDFFPPPEVPPDFTARHTHTASRAHLLALTAATASVSAAGVGAGAGAAAGGGGGAVGALLAPPPPPSPEVPPPSDPDLRREIEALAAQVARSGPFLEQIARKQAVAAASSAGGPAGPSAGAPATEGADGGVAGGADRSGARGKYSFFVTGEGLPYYLWRLHKIRTALKSTLDAVQAAAPPPLQRATAPAPGPSSAATTTGSRRAGGGAPAEPLTVEQRMALLGEQPLPATAVPTSAAATGPTTKAAAAAASAANGSGVGGGGGGDGTAVRPQVAEADRQHLQALLASNFVRGESQDLGTDTAAPLAGLRLGARHATAAAAAAVAFLSRFTSGSTSETAVLQPDGAGGLQKAGGSKEAADEAGDGGGEREPLRTSEEWRPEPLLCKRFNVPNPYKGKPPPQQVSRFRTDHLALPETSNLAINPTAATATLLSASGLAAVSLPPPPSGGQSAAVAAAPALALPPPPPLPGRAHLSQLPPPPPLPPAMTLPSHVAPPLGPPSAFMNLPPPPLPPPPPMLLPSQPQLPPAASTAADAATAFLSAFGQTLAAPVDHGVQGQPQQSAPPPLPPGPPTAAPLPPPIPVPPTTAASSETVALAPPVSRDEDLVVIPLDKPLDLFAAIFEAESEDEEEEAIAAPQVAVAAQITELVEGVPATVAEAGPQQQLQGQGQAAVMEHSAPQAVAGPAKSLAEALMRAQELSAKRAEESRTVAAAAALQDTLGAPHHGQAGGMQQVQAMAVMAVHDVRGGGESGGGIMGPVDPEVQDRIRAALSLFRRHHRSKGKDKDKDRDKGRDKKKKKRKRKERDKSRERSRELSKKARKSSKKEGKEKDSKREKKGKKERREDKRRRRKERGVSRERKEVREERRSQRRERGRRKGEEEQEKGEDLDRGGRDRLPDVVQGSWQRKRQRSRSPGVDGGADGGGEDYHAEGRERRLGSDVVLDGGDELGRPQPQRGQGDAHGGSRRRSTGTDSSGSSGGADSSSGRSGNSSEDEDSSTSSGSEG